MKIKKIKIIKVDNEPVYDITVPEHHNFLLKAGVFVHNCAACIYKAFSTPIQTNLTELADAINKYNGSITTQAKPLQYNLPKKPMTQRQAMQMALKMFNRM